MIDLIFVGDRCCDHSLSSGYDQICALFPEAGWLSGFELIAGRLTWFREPQAGAAAAPRIFHVFNGDCNGKLVPEILRHQYPDAVIISTAHQPVVRLSADAQACAALNASDAIITVSEIQARELASVGFAPPIYAIPHGVWTHVFRSPHARSDQPRQNVLIVGSFLRDWTGAQETARYLAREGVRPIALGAGAHANLVGHDTGIDVPPRVSEAELAEMYERSAAVFLPFLEATASNALLEAMAAGCPVVCPRMPSLVDEYLGDDADAFEAGRYDLAAARLLHYVRNPDARAAKRQVLMERAETFDWSHLKPRFTEVYQDVVAHTLR